MDIPIVYSIFYLVSMIIYFILMGISFKKYPELPNNEKFPKYMKKIIALNKPSDKFDTNNLPKRKKYSIFSRMVSGLGNLLCGSAPYFNFAVKLIGTSSTLLGYYTFILLDKNFISIMGFIGFEIGCIGIILLGILTENRHQLHGVAAALSFGGYLSSVVFWIYPFINSEFIPNWFVLFNILPIICCVYHIIANRKFDIHLQMQDTKITKIIDNYNFSEWLLLISVVVWIVLLYFILLI
jgi:hypothetical protein